MVEAEKTETAGDLFLKRYDLHFLEAYSSEELFYKRYYELRSQPEALRSFLAPYRVSEFWLPGINSERQKANQVHTIFDYFDDDIMVTKHTRFYPQFIHKHVFFEIMVVIKGSCENTVGGRRLRMTSGDICIIPPGEIHTIGIFDDSIAINILIKRETFDDAFFSLLPQEHFLTDFFRKNLYLDEHIPDNYVLIHIEDDLPAETAICALIYEDLLRHRGMEQKANALLKKNLVLTILNYFACYRNENGNMVKVSSGNPEKMNEILKYISDRHATASLEEVAAHFHYSPQHLSKLILESTGFSFIRILQKAKIARACFLLATTKMKICDIPGSVGYDSLLYFNRIFKKEMGVTPSRYRSLYVNHIPRQ